MDWHVLIASGLTFIGSIAIVSTKIGKYLPVTQKYVTIAGDSLALVQSILIAAKPDADGKVTFTADEMKDIELKAIKLQADFSK